MRTISGRIALPDGSLLSGRITFDGTVESIEAHASASSDFILPGLIDLQVNGSHGLDVMSASSDDILKISEQLAREGTTMWMPTAVTSPIDRIEKVHAAIAEAMETRADAQIIGMHLEGPFISPMRLGAHPKLNLEPRGEAFERVMAMDHLKLITMAPELAGAIDAIRRLAARGTIVSIGHSNATFEEASQGIAAGATMFTHTFNAMRPLNHRDPGVITAALTTLAATPAVIPDGVHLHPEILRLIYNVRGASRMILTTDKVSLAGTAPDSSGEVGRARARIENGAARLPDGTIAGAIISMLDGVRLMVDKVGVSIAEAALMASTNPAELIGKNGCGRLQAGARADVIILNAALELKSVFIAGRELT